MVWQSALGLVVFVALAWGLSENRRAVSWRLVFTGLGLQLVLGIVLLKGPFVREAFLVLNQIILALEQSTRAGTAFVFGYVGGGDLPFELKYPQNSFIFAFQALPLILLMSALSAVLFHWKILPLVVRGFAWCLQRTLRVGGTEGLGVAANIFVGMVEAPLFIRPYLRRMTRSEIFTLMTCGMATIAGTVMVLYASILAGVVPDAMGHILTASIISAPAAIMLAKIVVPETRPLTPGELTAPEPAASTMDALTKGTLQGVTLLINVVAMLLVLLACVALVNFLLGFGPQVAGAPLSLQRVLGWLMAPVAFLMGVPAGEAVA
ncbi:MAG: nucleoside transporter C-terminal domain-containing protein, partial [Desulfobacterales bacterium]